jgi:hypothetical protein
VACELVEFLYRKEGNGNIKLSKQDVYQNLVRTKEQDKVELHLDVALWWMQNYGMHLTYFLFTLYEILSFLYFLLFYFNVFSE